MGAVASPSVRKLAADRGVDIDALAAGLGRETIGREDLPGGARATGPAAGWDVDHSRYGPIEVEPPSRPARVAAANLSAAQALISAVAHRDSADMTGIETARAGARSRDARISALAFHVAILARCLKEFPRLNSSLSPDGRSLILKRHFHIGIAVDAPRGLCVPVVRDANRKRVPDISEEIADIAARVRGRMDDAELEWEFRRIMSNG